jgi:Ankyrin repeats (3 copies)
MKIFSFFIVCFWPFLLHPMQQIRAEPRILEMIDNDNIEGLKTWLGIPHDLLSIRDNEGYTLFHRAALYRKPEIMRILLAKDPRLISVGSACIDGNERTPLLTAIRFGHCEIVEWLLEKAPSCLNDRLVFNNQSPLLIAGSECVVSDEMKYKIMDLLLRNAPAELFHEDIHILAYFGIANNNFKLTEFSLAMGADPYAPLPDKPKSYQRSAGIETETPLGAAEKRFVHCGGIPQNIAELLRNRMSLRLDAWNELQNKERNALFAGQVGQLDALRVQLQAENRELRTELGRSWVSRLPALMNSPQLAALLFVTVAILAGYLSVEGSGLWSDSFKFTGKIIVTVCVAGVVSVLGKELVRIRLELMKATDEVGIAWKAFLGEASRVSGHIIGFLSAATAATREVQNAMAVLAASTKKVSDSIVDLATETRDVVVTLEREIEGTSSDMRKLLVELRGSGIEVRDAIIQGISAGHFKPEAKVDVRIERINVRNQKIFGIF